MPRNTINADQLFQNSMDKKQEIVVTLLGKDMPYSGYVGEFDDESVTLVQQCKDFAIVHVVFRQSIAAVRVYQSKWYEPPTKKVRGRGRKARAE